MKRAVLVVLALAAALAAGYGYIVTNREQSHRELVERGDAAMALGDFSTAIEAFSGAIALKSDSMIGYLKRGDAYRRRDELEAALRDLKVAAELDPTATRPRELLGDVNYARHRYGPATEHYRAYVALDDSSPRVLYKLALARYRDGHAAVGIDDLNKAVALDPRFAEAHYLLGLCLREAQKPTEALRSLQHAIDIAPAMIQAREELADLYAHLNRTDESLAQLEALRALAPGAARDVALGLAYADAGQTDRAIITLRHAAERHPTNAATFVALGRVWLDVAATRADRVDLGKALEALAQAVDPGTNQPTSEAYMLYGRALLLAADLEAAERTLRHATETLPVDPLAFYYLADAADRQGHYAVARQALFDYEALAKEEPDNRKRAALATRIADLSMHEADFPTAIAYYERAAPALGNDATFLVKFGEARWRSGNVDQAKALVAKALEKDPANAAARTLARRLR